MTGMRRSKRFTGTYRDLTVYTKTNYSKELNEVHHLGVLLWALLTTGSTETFHSEAGVRRFHDAFDLEGIRKRLSTEEWSESLQLLIWAYEAIAVMLTKDEAGRVSLSEMCELDFLKPENQCRK